MMRSCWSCHGAVADGDFCGTCQAIQPPQPGVDPFALFGLPPTFTLDRDQLELRYRQMQQQFHPDRFALRSATERRFSLEHVTQLNEGYRTLRDAIARGEALLTLRGETSTGRKSDPAFLMEVMELRETLEEIRPGVALAEQRLDRLRRGIEERLTGEERGFAAALETSLERAARHLDQARYFRKFLEEVERVEERLTEDS